MEYYKMEVKKNTKKGRKFFVLTISETALIALQFLPFVLERCEEEYKNIRGTRRRISRGIKSHRKRQKLKNNT